MKPHQQGFPNNFVLVFLEEKRSDDDGDKGE